MTPPSTTPTVERDAVAAAETLGPLSVAELQQALRNARTPPPPSQADDWRGDFDSAADPDLDAEYVDDDPTDINPEPVDGKARRFDRSKPGGGAKPPRRGRATRAVRRLLGLDRGPKGERMERGDGDWLADFDRPTPVPAGPTSPRPVADAVPDVDVTAAPRGLVAVFWRWIARIAVAVLLLAGVNQVFLRPTRTAVSPAQAAGIDVAAASQVAARFAADYLTYQPATGALSMGAASLSPSGWSGTAHLTTDLVEPGSTVEIDAQQVLVSVAARIHIDRTAAGQPASTPTPSTSRSVSPATAAAASPNAAGQAQQWVTLIVPVQSDGNVLQVVASGPVFTGEAPAGVTPTADSQPDAATTAATQPIVATFLAAYARSDVSYLASPGVSMTGLAGVLQFMSLTGWSLSAPATWPGVEALSPSGVGSGTVLWQLAGTDLQIAQRYSISLTSAQGRWYASAVAPDLTDLEG